jgi:spermidine synthase
VRQRKGGPLRVAVVGLGTGSLACYREPGDDWRFLEIDPAVVAIARDPRRFRFLQSCAPDMPIVLGDARLTLAREPDGHYDLIIVDAYASDAIPVHLATTEAMALYKSKLAAGGLVAMHISSRYFELASVVAGIAAVNQMKTWAFDDNAVDRNSEYILSSDVVVAARDENDIGALATDWKPLAPPGGQRVWTDDYSDLLGAMIRAQTQ